MNTNVFLTSNNFYQKDIIESAFSIPVNTFAGQIINNSTRIGFLWENNGYQMPFGSVSYGVSGILTKEVVDWIDLQLASVGSLVVDLITCNLGFEQFISDINTLLSSRPNLKINYSVNLTGNPPYGDWIMESSGENISPIYFNNNISLYTGVLAPVAPSDISAYNIVNSQFIAVFWHYTQTDASGFNVNVTGNATATVSDISSSRYTRFDGGSGTGKNVNYSVTVIDKFGVTASSPTYSLNTNNGLPAANSIIDISVNPVTTSSIDISWTNATGGQAAGYYIVDCSYNGKYRDWRRVDGTANTKYTWTGLQQNTIYQFRILSGYSTTQGGKPYHIINDPNGVYTRSSPVSVAQLVQVANVLASPGDTSANVTWTDTTNPNTTTYNLRVFDVLANNFRTDLSKNNILFANKSQNITNLTNGNQYYFVVNAVNYGITSADVSSSIITPFGVPNAPTNLNILQDISGSATVEWFSPAVNGGSAITAYHVKTWDAFTNQLVRTSADLSTNPLNYSDSNLTNGFKYYFTIQAKNARGYSNDSVPSATVYPSTVPSAPTITSVSDTSGAATVSWSAPVYNGGADISAYKIETWDSVSGLLSTDTVSSSTHTFTNGSLTNGRIYYFKVYAGNYRGYSSPSQSSNVYPSTVPNVPEIISVSDTSGSATVSWSGLEYNGGADISAYKIETWDSVSGLLSTATVSGSTFTYTNGSLTNGRIYYFKVYSGNHRGYSSPAQSSNVYPSTVPNPVTNVLATPGDTSLNVSWVGPVNTGGADLSNYTLDLYESNIYIRTESITSSPFIFTGLTNGLTYYVKVYANNIRGASVSAQSNNVVPYGVPFAPTITNVVGNDTSANINWIAEGTNGADISFYTVELSPNDLNNFTVVATPGPHDISVNIFDLSNSIPYYLRISKTNIYGLTSPYGYNNVGGIPSYFITAGHPLAPAKPTVVPGDTQVTISWTDPFNNGADISSYTILYYYNGNPISYQIHNLLNTSAIQETYIANINITNGLDYYFRIFATNINGDSPLSEQSDVVIPYGRPSAPTNLDISSGDSNVTVSWKSNYRSLVDGNGRDISYYTIDLTDLTTSTTQTTNVKSHISNNYNYKFNGLTNGHEYTWAIYATTIPDVSSDLVTLDLGTIADYSNIPGTPPSKPLNLSYQLDTATTSVGGLNVSWTAPESDGSNNLLEYILYANHSIVQSVNTLITSLDVSLPTDVIYHLNVSAVNAKGETLSDPTDNFMPIDIANINPDKLISYTNEQLAVIKPAQYESISKVLSTFQSSDVSNTVLVKAQVQSYQADPSNNKVYVPQDPNNPVELVATITQGTELTSNDNGSTVTVTTADPSNFIILNITSQNLNILDNPSALIYFKVVDSNGNSVVSLSQPIEMILYLPNISTQSVVLYKYDNNQIDYVNPVYGIEIAPGTHAYRAIFVSNSSWVIFTSNIQTGGDPHIRPLNGSQYILPNDIKYVNLLSDKQHQVVFNAETSLLGFDKFNPVIYSNNSYLNSKNIDYLYNYTYYTKYYIQYQDEIVIIDSDSLVFYSNKDLTKIKVEQINSDTGIYSLVFNKSYPKFDTTKQLKVSFGPYTINLQTDIMTDERHFVSINASANLSNCFGAVISKNTCVKLGDLVGKTAQIYKFSENNHINNLIN